MSTEPNSFALDPVRPMLSANRREFLKLRELLLPLRGDLLGCADAHADGFLNLVDAVPQQLRLPHRLGQRAGQSLHAFVSSTGTRRLLTGLTERPDSALQR